MCAALLPRLPHTLSLSHTHANTCDDIVRTGERRFSMMGFISPVRATGICTQPCPQSSKQAYQRRRKYFLFCSAGFSTYILRSHASPSRHHAMSMRRQRDGRGQMHAWFCMLRLSCMILEHNSCQLPTSSNFLLECAHAVQACCHGTTRCGMRLRLSRKMHPQVISDLLLLTNSWR